MFYFPLLEKLVEVIKRQGGWVYWSWVVITGLLGAFFIKSWAEYGFDNSKVLLGALILFWFVGGLVVSHFEKKEQTK